MIMVLLLLVLCTPLGDKYSKEHPLQRVVYVVPGIWLLSPSARWIMMIRHCGPDPLYNVALMFTDEDRGNQIASRGIATPEDINETHASLTFPEIDPTQGGGSFFWAPINPDDENYNVRIASRDSMFDETLKIVRVSRMWLNRIKVSEVTTGKEIINCRDTGYPDSTAEYLPVCFPHYISEPHQNVCR
jgi:hypothetical protein